MSSVHLVVTDDATGRVVQEWRGDSERPPVFPAGRTARDAAAHGGLSDFSGKRWNGSAFDDVVPPPVRQIDPLDFARRFTLDEEARIDALAGTDSKVKSALRRLSLVKDKVDLDHTDVVFYLGYLKQVSIDAATPAEAKIWPDAATSDARIAEIRA